jgi:hypothetical protein
MVPSNDANEQRRVESACMGADSLPSAMRNRKIETLIPAILMVLQHQYSMVTSNGANAKRRTLRSIP